MRRRFAGLVFLFFGLSLVSGCSESAVRFSHGLNQAPDFTLPRVDSPSEKLTLSDFYQKQPVLLIFWATWCPSCVEEIPVLNEWQAKYPKLQILAVNVQEDRESILKFQNEQAMNYPCVIDADGKVADAYGLSGIPTSVLLAKGGEILYYGFTLPQNIRSFLSENFEGSQERGLLQ